MVCRVGILDDHRSFGEALCLALASTEDFECVGVTTGFDHCREMLLTMKPDVLVIDYQLVGMTGFECADLIREEGIIVRTVMLTAHASSGGLQDLALEHGVEQVLSKDSPLSQLLHAIANGPADVLSSDSVAPAFSRRQREVLELMGKGYAPADIAEELFVSIHTARRHVKDVMGVLGASTQLAAVTTAIRDGHLVPGREST
jgi:two-component system response regulator DesR